MIGLIESAGLRLQEATDALNGFGQMYLSQAMASGVIPQIAAVFGTDVCAELLILQSSIFKYFMAVVCFLTNYPESCAA